MKKLIMSLTPKEIVSMILSYESRIIDLHERAECEKDYDYKERIDDLIKRQVELIENFRKEACLDILEAAKAWLQVLRNSNEPINERDFKTWYDEYMEITKQK